MIKVKIKYLNGNNLKHIEFVAEKLACISEERIFRWIGTTEFIGKQAYGRNCTHSFLKT